MDSLLYKKVYEKVINKPGFIIIKNEDVIVEQSKIINNLVYNYLLLNKNTIYKTIVKNILKIYQIIKEILLGNKIINNIQIPKKSSLKAINNYHLYYDQDGESQEEEGERGEAVQGDEQ